MMSVFGVVKLIVSGQRASCITNTVIRFEVNLHIIHAAQQTFDEHVVYPPSFAIHTDIDVGAFKYANEIIPGELAALIRVVSFSPLPNTSPAQRATASSTGAKLVSQCTLPDGEISESTLGWLAS
jgi:hypothetical protein